MSETAKLEEIVPDLDQKLVDLLLNTESLITKVAIEDGSCPSCGWTGEHASICLVSEIRKMFIPKYDNINGVRASGDKEPLDILKRRKCWNCSHVKFVHHGSKCAATERDPLVSGSGGEYCKCRGYEA